MARSIEEVGEVALQDWTVQRGIAPQVRVALVLPQDACHTVTIEPLDAQFTLQELHSDDDTVPTSSAPPGRPVSNRSHTVRSRTVRSRTGELCGRSLAFRQSPGGDVAVRLDDDDMGRASAWTLAVAGEPSPTAFRCRNLRIGRGFHWESQVDQCVPGPLEVRVRDGALLVVATLAIEDYLLGVITAEMSNRCPPAFLMAQCVAARSWLLARSERKHDSLGVDICNDDCCQRFHGLLDINPAARAAVNQTTGQILTVGDNAVVDANYSKNCGGISESPQFVWGRPKPGPQPVVDAPQDSPAHHFFPVTESRLDPFLTGPWLAQCDAYCSPTCVPEADLPGYLGSVDDGQGRFRWSLDYGREELESILNASLFESARSSSSVAASRRDDMPSIGTLLDLRVTRRGVSGRAGQLRITYLDDTGRRHRRVVEGEYAIRDALHERFLYSSAIAIQIARCEDGSIERIELRGAGWGHGVGLCQIGGLGRALEGQDYRTILAAYFPAAEIQQAYPAVGGGRNGIGKQ